MESLIAWLADSWAWLFGHWLTQEKFWVAISSIVTASALVFTIFRHKSESTRAVKNVRNALTYELITNLNSIFNGGVDRILLFDGIKLLRTQFLHSVKDEARLGKLQRLYIEMEDYDRFVKTVYLTDSGVDRRYVTQKHLDLINIFRRHFGEKAVAYTIESLDQPETGNSYIEQKRDVAKAIYREKGNDWAARIRKLMKDVI